MKQSVTFFSLCVLSFLTMFVFTSCCDDEPVVIPPHVDPAAPSVTGVITTNGGKFLPGATVTLTSLLDSSQTFTASSDANGNFKVTVVPGAFAISVSCEGYSSHEGVFQLVEGQVVVYNAVLPKVVVVSNEISPEGSYVEVPVPPLVETEGETEKIMTATIPPASVDEDDELIIEFDYVADIRSSKASLLMNLVKVNYHLKSGKQLKKPIRITLPVQADAQEVKLNEKDVTYNFDGTQIVIETQELGQLELNYLVDVSVRESTVPVAFERSVWDNMYGSDRMWVTDSKCTLKKGGEISGNHVFMKSLAAVYTGVSSYTTEQIAYPINVELPVGALLQISAQQTVKTTTFTIAGGLLNSKVVSYETATFTVITRNREHTGGSN